MIFKFELGKKEEHTVTIDISKMNGTIKILIDNDIIQKGSLGPYRGAKEWKFIVGKKEKHNVKMVIHFPFFQFSRWKHEVFMDEKLYNTYMG